MGKAVTVKGDPETYELWYGRRNRERKARYRNDPKYREEVLAKTRKPPTRRVPDPEDVWSASHGAMCYLYKEDGTGPSFFDHCFTICEAAKILHLRPSSLLRWMRTSRFPKPIYRLTRSTKFPVEWRAGQGVYTVEQLYILALALEGHFELMNHLRVTHTETIRKLHEAMEDV